MTRVERNGRTALADTIADRLREYVAKAGTGARLPPVRQLMSTFGVSQHAIQKALDQLREENLITSHVGKGTFVGDTAGLMVPSQIQTRSVLTLTRERPYERGDAIARYIHQRLLIDGHTSLVVAYNDERHLMEQLRGDMRFSGCIIQPRASTISTSLLDFARQRADRVIIEAFDAEGIDVDAVSNDPLLTVELIMSTLRQAGHERILWVTEERSNYFFRRTADLFHAYCVGMGISSKDVPLMTFPVDQASPAGSARLGAALDRELGRDPTITALVLATFLDGVSILKALADVGLHAPRDISVIRMGSPDLESDHVNTVDVVGRPSARAAQTVVDLLYRLWKQPSSPPATLFDAPERAIFGSVGVLPMRRDLRPPRSPKTMA